MSVRSSLKTLPSAFIILLGFLLMNCTEKPKEDFLLLLAQREQDAYRVYSVKPDGTQLTPRAEFALGDLYWVSPTGKHIALYTRSEDPLIGLPAHSLAILELSSGEIVDAIERVGNTQSEHLSHYEEVVWSPRGDKLIFIRDSSSGKGIDLWLHNLEMGLTTPLTADEAFEWSPAWSADEEKIAFVRSNACGQSVWECPPEEQYWDIMVMDADGSNQRLVADLRDSSLLPTGDDVGAWLDHLLCRLSWSPDKRFITFEDVCGWQPGLWNQRLAFIVQVESGRITQLTDFIDEYDPDSTLSIETATNYSSQWLGTGNQLFLAYTRPEIKPAGNVYHGILVIDTDNLTYTSSQTEISQITAYTAVWSPNKRYVAGSKSIFLDQGTSPGLAMVVGEWSNEQDSLLPISAQLPRSHYYEGEVHWSPDSRYFAYALAAPSDEEEQWGVAVVSLTEEIVINVVESQMGDWRPIGWVSADWMQP
jgi:hypothetical protein